LAQALPGHVLHIVGIDPVQQRLHHADPIGQPAFYGLLGLDQKIIAPASRVDIETNVAAAPANTEIMDLAAFAAEPGHAIAQGVDGIVADQLGQWAAEQGFRLALFQQSGIEAGRFDPPIGADQEQQRA
jgi:hypothetical protein